MFVNIGMKAGTFIIQCSRGIHYSRRSIRLSVVIPNLITSDDE